MMINSIKIQNFQKHRTLKLRLTEGINVITGTSNVGKTAIIRALTWLIFNRPLGNGIVRQGADKPTKVVLQNEIGKVSKIRKQKKTTYSVDGEGELAAVKHEIPELVRKTTRLASINFQNQHDPPFLLTSSPGEVAAKINELVNLQVIDEIISRTNKLIRENNWKTVKTTEQLAEQKIKLENYDYLDGANQKIKELRWFFVKLDNNWGSLEKLKTEINIFQIAKSAVLEQQNVLELREHLKATQNLTEQMKSAIRMSEKLNSVIILYRKHKNAVNATIPIEKAKSMQMNFAKLNQLSKESDLWFKYSQTESKIQQIDDDLEELLEEKANLISEKAKIPICPTCRRPLYNDEEN